MPGVASLVQRGSNGRPGSLPQVCTHAAAWHASPREAILNKTQAGWRGHLHWASPPPTNAPSTRTFKRALQAVNGGFVKRHDPQGCERHTRRNWAGMKLHHGCTCLQEEAGKMSSLGRQAVSGGRCGRRRGLKGGGASRQAHVARAPNPGVQLQSKRQAAATHPHSHPPSLPTKLPARLWVCGARSKRRRAHNSSGEAGGSSAALSPAALPLLGSHTPQTQAGRSLALAKAQPRSICYKGIVKSI